MTTIANSWADAGITPPPGATGSVRITCPKCSHHRKKKNDRCLSLDLDKGLWICFNCDDKGRLKVPPDGSWQGTHDSYEAVDYESEWQSDQAWQRIQELNGSNGAAAEDEPSAWVGPVNHTPEPKPLGKIIPVENFVEYNIPERKMLLDPVLVQESSMMIYARAGVGKSYLAQCLIAAVTTGREFLGWKPQAEIGENGIPFAPLRKGIIFDGELASYDFQTRLKSIETIYPGFTVQTTMYSADWAIKQGEQPLNIADPEHQPHIIAASAGHDVVLLDNKSALAYTPGISENDAAAFEPIWNLIRELNANGSAVVLIHHAGKGNTQRGSSRAEDNVEVIMKLEVDQQSYEGEDIAYTVSFDKNRNANRTTLTVAPQFEDRKLVGWDWEETATKKKDEILAMLNEGMTVKDVVKMGFTQSQVYRLNKERTQK